MNTENIRQIRKEKGLTQEELARRIGVKRSVISKYENGSVEPSLKQLKKIADALEVPMGILIADSVGNEKGATKTITFTDKELRLLLAAINDAINIHDANINRKSYCGVSSIMNRTDSRWIMTELASLHERINTAPYDAADRGRLVSADWLSEEEMAEYLRVQEAENVWIKLLNEAVHQRVQRILSEIPIAK